MTDKSEAAKSTDDEQLAADQEAARLEGLRSNPGFRMGTVDTTEGTVNMHDVSPVFRDAQRDAVLHAARVVEDDEVYDPTVIMPEDPDEAERAREDLRRQADEANTDLQEREEARARLREAEESERQQIEQERADAAKEQADAEAEQNATGTAKTASKTPAKSTGTSTAAKRSTASKTTGASASDKTAEK